MVRPAFDPNLPYSQVCEAASHHNALLFSGRDCHNTQLQMCAHIPCLSIVVMQRVVQADHGHGACRQCSGTSRPALRAARRGHWAVMLLPKTRA